MKACKLVDNVLLVYRNTKEGIFDMHRFLSNQSVIVDRDEISYISHSKVLKNIHNRGQYI